MKLHFFLKNCQCRILFFHFEVKLCRRKHSFRIKFHHFHHDSDGWHFQCRLHIVGQCRQILVQLRFQGRIVHLYLERIGIQQPGSGTEQLGTHASLRQGLRIEFDSPCQVLQIELSVWRHNGSCWRYLCRLGTRLNLRFRCSRCSCGNSTFS